MCGRFWLYGEEGRLETSVRCQPRPDTLIPNTNFPWVECVFSIEHHVMWKPYGLYQRSFRGAFPESRSRHEWITRRLVGRIDESVWHRFPPMNHWPTSVWTPAKRLSSPNYGTCDAARNVLYSWNPRSERRKSRTLVYDCLIGFLECRLHLEQVSFTDEARMC